MSLVLCLQVCFFRLMFHCYYPHGYPYLPKGWLLSQVKVRPKKNICVFQVSQPYPGFCPDPKHFIVNCEPNVVRFARKWGKIYWKILWQNKMLCRPTTPSFFRAETWNMHIFFGLSIIWPKRLSTDPSHHSCESVTSRVCGGHKFFSENTVLIICCPLEYLIGICRESQFYIWLYIGVSCSLIWKTTLKIIFIMLKQSILWTTLNN